MAAAIVGLQLGALGVVLETWLSGISELSFAAFILLMQPIHLAIGVVEGLITAAVVSFVWKARPEILAPAPSSSAARTRFPVLASLALLTIVTAGMLFWFASTHPDGLEWAVKGVTGKEELEAPKEGVYGLMGWIQESLSFLPDYDFKKPEGEKEGKKEETWPEVSSGKSLAGLLGAGMTLLLAGVIGLGLRRYYSHGKG
jgi:cobalt/nickel transport system permease protein